MQYTPPPPRPPPPPPPRNRPLPSYSVNAFRTRPHDLDERVRSVGASALASTPAGIVTRLSPCNPLIRPAERVLR
jgi:hypothetical protein